MIQSPVCTRWIPQSISEPISPKPFGSPALGTLCRQNTGKSIDIISSISRTAPSITTPERPLYLGQSDDLVDVTTFQSFDIEEIESDYVDSVVEEIVPGATIEKLPYKFFEENGKYSVEFKLVSIPKSIPIKLSSKKNLYRYLDKNIQIL